MKSRIKSTLVWCLGITIAGAFLFSTVLRAEGHDVSAAGVAPFEELSLLAQADEAPRIYDTGASERYQEWTASAKSKERYQSPTAALLKSAVVPGWGQFGNHEYTKAGIVIAIETTLFLRWLHFRNQTVDARELFENESDLTQKRIYFTQFEEVRNDRNLFAWLTGVSIFLSMIDAFVDAHLAEFPQVSPAVGSYTDPTQPITPGVTLSLKF